jgi:type I restriction enzyme S subunit
MVINVGASAGTIGFSNCKFWSSDGCFCISHSELLDNKYLFYYLQTKTHYLQSQVRYAGIPTLDNPVIEKIMLPLLSLSEQKRIVDKLDTFTSSIENLKEQIAQRRKQYEYYRDQLLDLEGKPGVEMKALGEIGEFIRGNGIQKSDFVEDGFCCIHYGQIHAKYGFSAKETISKIEESLYKRCKKAKKGDVVLATTSEDAEGVAKPFVWLGEDDAAVSGDAFIYHHNQIGKFMGYQFLTHKFMQFKVKYATGAKVVRISGDNMAKYEVALPSIEEQSRIVSILDTFEASIANLEEQLAQRQKQYEYYRNKLLTFE